jgi:hypothetical protein
MLDLYTNWSSLRQELIDDISEYNKTFYKKAASDLVNKLSEGVDKTKLKVSNDNRVIEYQYDDDQDFDFGKRYFEKVIDKLGDDWVRKL